MVDIRYGAAISAAGGPTLSFSRTLTADAYNVIDVPVPSGGPLEVSLGAASDKITLLVITAAEYDADLTYALASGGTDFALDQPAILAGGSVAIGGNFSSLFFTNNVSGSTSIDVQILVARDPLV